MPTCHFRAFVCNFVSYSLWVLEFVTSAHGNLVRDTISYWNVKPKEEEVANYILLNRYLLN